MVGICPYVSHNGGYVHPGVYNGGYQPVYNGGYQPVYNGGYGAPRVYYGGYGAPRYNGGYLSPSVVPGWVSLTQCGTRVGMVLPVIHQGGYGPPCCAPGGYLSPVGITWWVSHGGYLSPVGIPEVGVPLRRELSLW